MRDIAAKSHLAYIGVGANLGRRIDALHHAVEHLGWLGPVACSDVYETAPVGYQDQPDFLNMVVSLCTDYQPLALLDVLLGIEAQYGRERSVRFGPRSLDLDILLYDNRYVCYRNLQIPHPRMWERGFVVVPLANLAPSYRAPGGLSVAELAARFRNKGDIRHVGRFW